MNITEFLLARIAEDEAAAQAAIGTAAFSRQTGHWTAADVTDEYGNIPLIFAVAESGARTQVANFSEAWEANERRVHIARHDPARVLAECAAKRAIIEDHAEIVKAIEYLSAALPGDLNQVPDAPWRTAPMRHLAAVYKEHPDYQQEWGK